MPENEPGGGMPLTPPDGGTPAGGAAGAPAGETPPASFDEWLKGQDGTAQQLFQTHVQGLKTALETERTQRKDLEKQLAELAKTLGKDSPERKSLDELATKLSGMERQTAFYDAAHAAGMSNLRLAWLAANEAGLIDEKGKVDPAKLRESFPELFRVAAPATPPMNPARGNAVKLTKDDLHKLSPDEINRRWDEIQVILAQQ